MVLLRQSCSGESSGSYRHRERVHYFPYLGSDDEASQTALEQLPLTIAFFLSKGYALYSIPSFGPAGRSFLFGRTGFSRGDLCVISLSLCVQKKVAVLCISQQRTRKPKPKNSK
jgi:hypothetical protein